MKNVHKKLFICMLACLMVICMTSTALASYGLQWKTTNVYFQGDRLIVKGYFHNNTNKTIDRINWFKMRVQLHNKHKGWFEHASASFGKMRAHMRPGETMSHKFVIDNVDRRHFDDYRIRWRVNYHYRNNKHNHHHENYDHER